MLGASRASNRTKVIYIAEANEDVEAGAATTPKLSLTHEEAPGTTHDAPPRRFSSRARPAASTRAARVGSTILGVVLGRRSAERRRARQTESARTLLTHEPHELLDFYDAYSLAKMARRSPLWVNFLLRALIYVWPPLCGACLVYRLGPGSGLSVGFFTLSLMVTQAGGQATWVRCRQLSFIVDVTDERCLSDADACYKWVRRAALLTKIIIYAMIFVATPLEVAYVCWTVAETSGSWAYAVPAGALYAASHVAGRAESDQRFLGYPKKSSTLSTAVKSNSFPTILGPSVLAPRGLDDWGESP